MVKLHSYDGSKVSFYYMDEHAKKARWWDIYDIPFEELVDHLSEVLQSDQGYHEVLMARGFLVWASEAFNRRTQRFGRKLSQHFKTFCETANIDCVEIHGKAKGDGYQAGDTRVTEFTWNAFRSSGTWHFLNPHWCVQSILGADAGGRVALEADGQANLREIQFQAGTRVSFFNADWFCVDPDVFLLTHFPDDSSWQLRARSNSPASFLEWLNMPYLQSGFFKHNLSLVSEESCRLKTANGKCNIVFSGDKGAFKNLAFSYSISMKRSDVVTHLPSNLPRIVVPQRMDHDDLFKYEVGCPVKGVYFLEIYIYDTKADEFSECCEGMIICDAPNPNCRKAPVDTGTLGFGFGPTAEEAGLKKPSEKGGFVVTGSDEDRDQDQVGGRTIRNQVGGKDISFGVDQDAINLWEYGSAMCDGEEKAPVASHLDVAKRQLVITAPIKPDSEYALALSKRKKGSREEFEPVLYYLVTTSDQGEEAENERLTVRIKEKRRDNKLEEKIIKNASLKEQLEQKRAEVNKLFHTVQAKKDRPSKRERRRYDT